MKRMRNRPFRTRRTIMKTRKGSHCGNAPGNPAATANPTCRTGPRTAALSPSCRASLPRRGPQTAADPGAGGCTTRGNSPADGAKCAGTLRKSYGRSPAIHALSFRCGTGGSATFAKEGDEGTSARPSSVISRSGISFPEKFPSPPQISESGCSLSGNPWKTQSITKRILQR